MSVGTDSVATEQGLGRRVGRGLGWSFLNNVVSRLGTFLSGIVLARLLVPEDFGMFAVALVVLNAGLSMNELGVSLAIVRWQEGVDRIAPTVTTLALAWSGLLYVICFLAAPSLATSLNTPGAAPLIRVLCLGILFDAVACVSAALITRQFMQGTRMAIDLISFGVGTGTSVVLAVLGLGAWCIVWGFLVTSVVSSVLTLARAPRRYRPGFDLAASKELLAFGLPLAGSSLLVFFMVNIDYVVVGRVLGGESLGFYLLAFNLCSWPVSLISVAIRRVSLAGFSRIADEPWRAGAAFSHSAGLVMAVTLPLCAALAGYAPAVVSFLYGAAWLPSAEALRLLCVLGAARVGVELAYDYLVAVGRTRTNLAVQGMWACVLVPALAVGAHVNGIVGVATAHALVAGLLVAPAYAVALRRADVGWRSLLRACRRPVAAAFLVGAVATVVTRAEPLTPVGELLIGGVATLAVVGAVLAPLRHTVRATLVGGERHRAGAVTG